MPSDSAAQKLATSWSANLENRSWPDYSSLLPAAESMISAVENAGLLVIDPTDQETIERAAATLAEVEMGKPWERVYSQGHFLSMARGVISALSSPDGV